MQGVSRDELLAAFVLDFEAGASVKDALISGVNFDLWTDPVPATRLLGICSARYRNLKRRGKLAVGFEECIQALAARGGQGLLVAYVNDRERGGGYFQLFLEPDPLRVIGCTGVYPSSEGGPVAVHP